MAIFFNNCRSRNHAVLFGAGAFYDLDLHGRQGTMATNLQPNEECVVATPTEGGDIEFNWFQFLREEVRPHENGGNVRVLFGTFVRSETLQKELAIATEPYSIFFNAKGHFKRPSVIQPRGTR